MTVDRNARKGLEFADIGYVPVSGRLAIAGRGRDLLDNPEGGRLFLGGNDAAPHPMQNGPRR